MLMPALDFQPCVYILASRRNGTLYVGVTSDLLKRLHEHRTGAVSGFTRRYHVHRLVWFEEHATMELAIAREKAIKEWKRKWKLELIEKQTRIGVICTTRCLIEAARTFQALCKTEVTGFWLAPE